MAGKRASNAEVIQRVTELYAMLVRGKSTREVKAYAASTWSLSSSTVKEYIRRVNDRLQEDSKVVRTQELGKSIARKQLIISMAFESGDLHLAAKVDKSLDEFLSLQTEPDSTETLDRFIAALHGAAHATLQDNKVCE